MALVGNGDSSFLKIVQAKRKKQLSDAANAYEPTSTAEGDESGGGEAVLDEEVEASAGVEEGDATDADSAKRNKVKKILQYLRKQTPPAPNGQPTERRAGPVKPLRPVDGGGIRG